MKKYIFYLFSLCCLFAAFIHLQGYLGYREGNQMRHLFFLFLNLFGVFLMQKRPPFLVYLLPILIVQQYYSHGFHANYFYQKNGQLNALDVAVLIVLPIAYYFIWDDFKIKNK